MDLTNVSKKLVETTFLKDTILQIQKDFTAIGINVTLSSSNLNELELDLRIILQSLSPENFMQLAYVVDIGENKTREWMNSGGELSIYTHLIIQREALKVFLRKEFAR
ncbi:MAG: hypothetical protein ACKO5W_06085 [Crocinitomicaceae bacterium]